MNGSNWIPGRLSNVWPILLSMLAFVFVCISVAGGWSGGLVYLLAGLLPVALLIAIIGVAWFVLFESRRINALLDCEWMSVGSMQDCADVWVNFVHDPGQVQESEDEGVLVTEFAQAIRERFLAGDSLRIADLTVLLQDQADSITRNLVRAAGWAVSIGFVGNILGLAIQAWLAQDFSGDGILSQKFLFGCLIALFTTVTGVLVAIYAHLIRSQFEGELDAICKIIRRFFSSHVLPQCDPATRQVAQIINGLDDIIEKFNKYLADLKPKIDAELAENIRIAVDDINSAFATTINTDLSRILREAMSPLYVEIKTSAQQMQETNNKLVETTQVFTNELRQIIQSPKEMHEAQMEATIALKHAIGKLNDVATSAETVAGKLENAAGQIALSLENIYAAEESAKEKNKTKSVDADNFEIHSEMMKRTTQEFHEALSVLTQVFREISERDIGVAVQPIQE